MPNRIPLALAAACFLSLFQASAEDTRDDASPWAVASGAEWAGDYAKFDPLLRDAGIRWMRIFDEWGWIQPSQGEWKWDSMDAKLADAKKNNIRLTGGLWYAAPWATPKGDTRTVPLKDIQHWSDYVTAAVGRYSKDIKHWEVWNEFNGSFANSKDKPKDYAELVISAYKAAKKADPTCLVGMSCANFDLGFFDLAIKAGAGGHFDFICVHPYENLGLVDQGNEASFLSLAGSIRKMLADNKQKTDIPLWITEIGKVAPIQPDPEKDAAQADALVKCYVLSMAQGFERIFWFEIRGPAYGKGTDHGIIRKDWSLRPVYHAFKSMTSILGEEPRYLGWHNFDGGYGFLFGHQDRKVLVAWAPPGANKNAVFKGDVRVADVLGQVTPIATGKTLVLTSKPVYITDLPAAFAAEVEANKSKPFPWGGGYDNAPEVSCKLAATNIDKGIQQINPKTTAVVHELAESYRRTDIGNGALKGEGHYVYFRVDPAFAPFGTKELEITMVARSLPGKPASTLITYESMKGYKDTKERWTIPAGEQWSEHTWKVTDANFVGGWGWNFRANSSGSGNDFQIKEVRVKKVK